MDNHKNLTSPLINQNSGPNKRNNSFNHIPSIQKVRSYLRAYFIVKSLKSAFKEVDLIEKGIKKPKSLDQILNEL